MEATLVGVDGVGWGWVEREREREGWGLGGGGAEWWLMRRFREGLVGIIRRFVAVGISDSVVWS